MGIGEGLMSIKRIYLILALLMLCGVASAANPVSNFTADSYTGSISNVSPVINTTITFTDYSTTDITGWLWQFGDGSTNATTQNVTHEYGTIGNFTVNLTVTNSSGTNSLLKYVNITRYFASTDGAYTVIKFNETGYTATWKTPANVTSVQYLVVAGGGVGAAYEGGGGGGGGVLTNTSVVNGTITVVVGAGQTTQYTPGINSSFSNIVAIGGGSGGCGGGGGTSPTNSPGIGGSGGGGGSSTSAGTTGAAGTPSDGVTPPIQGYHGGTGTSGGNYPSGGGGGASLHGGDGTSTNGGSGGNGISSSITGSPVTYGGGGGGAIGNSQTGGVGGTGGGGNGASHRAADVITIVVGSNGTVGLGGGGGGGGYGLTPDHYYGGSGVVIIRYLTPVVPVINFTSNATTGITPRSIQFNDTTIGLPTSWNWSFGDGTYNTTQNPVYTYSSGGLYTVSLNATNSFGSNTTTKTNYIKVLETNFVGTPTTGTAPLSVAFNDTSTPYGNATAWAWNFGDGQQSTLQNITHVYTSAGSYNVTLNVTTDFTTGTKTQTNYITVSNLAPAANFYGVPAWGSSPLDVSFYDISTNGTATSWEWEWGDGTANGTTQNPTHQYTANGEYSVNMTATNAIGSSTKQRIAYIKVGTTGGGGGALESIFRSNTTGGIYPLSVQFTDLSTGGPETWNWSWGDATANGTTQNPTHTYTGAGSYTVTLTVTNATQTPNSSTSSATNFIVVANTGSPVSNFYADSTWGINYVNASFHDISTGGAATSWNWSMGDGTYNTTQNPIKNYTTVGTYTVSLNATNAEGSTVRTRTDYIQVSDGKPETSFYGMPTNGSYPLNVSFTDTSGNTPTSWAWSWGDGEANGTTQNPYHVYTGSGTYTVTLTATNSYGSNTRQISAYIGVTAPSVPIASFYAHPTNGTAPLNVSFVDTSANTPTSWAWQWGDGEANGTTQNPSHVYNTSGTYTVNMTATNAFGSNTKQIAAYIGVTNPSTPVSNFTANITGGYVPLSVLFTDSSTNLPTTWNWSFGDGTANGTTQNVTHAYTADGTYNVTLTAGNDGGNGTSFQRTDYIYAEGNPHADFSANVTTGSVPISVLFTDNATHASPFSFYWEFGDGNTSSDTAPVHVYTVAGNYSVNFSVSTPGGEDWENKTDYIRLTPANPVTVANFSANITSGTAPLSVGFIDLSTKSPVAWLWVFGDGSTNATTQNATHVYSSAGNFTVKLRATNIYGTSWENKTDLISVTVIPPPAADFSANETFGNPGTIFGFTDLSTNSPTSWQWSFGDGSGNSTVKNTTHAYSTTGVYTVTLTAYNVGGTDTEQKIGYINVTMAPVADFHANVTSGHVPISVQFNDTSLYATYWSWDLGDGNTSLDQNPVHTYYTENYYTIKLNASNANGSSWENKTNYLWFTNPPTPIPTATQVHSGGYAPPYQAPDVPFPQNDNTGCHLLNVSVDLSNQTVTFLGQVDNVTNDTTAWFTLGATTAANSYYTVALVPDPISGNVTGSMGLSSPMAAGTKYYVKMASTKGLALESLNFTTPAAVALPTSTYGAYWNKVQASNKTPLTIVNVIPLPLVDLFGGSAAGAGSEFGWRIVFTLLIGILVMVIAIRQDNLILVFMLIGLTGPVWLSLIVPEFVWIPATVCYLVAATTLYRLYRNRRS
jgi:PKD repeat protein